ncbi:MAG TPA: hypothetical protein GX707_10375 [Epulopiscium sp.]|nr:hypothetical protein [Candidatus Epulonipiscium sp.]
MIYKLGKCCYCGNTYLITRPTPFMADVPAMMCKECWDMTQEEYANCNGEYIGNFGDANGYKEIQKQELKEISTTIDELKGLKDALLGTELKEEKELAKSIGFLESFFTYKSKEMESGKNE